MLGLLVEKDVKRAEMLLQSAANENHIEACEQLFMMYNIGYGVKKDAQEAFKWRKRQFELVLEQKDTDDRKRSIGCTISFSMITTD